MEFKRLKDKRYRIYKDGTVIRDAYSIKDKNGRVHNYDELVLTPKVSNTGYIVVSINRKWTQLHRLVAEAFIPNPDNKPCVNHKDGNKLNPNADNLEWVTYKENQNHAEYNNLTGDRSGVSIDVFDDSGYIGSFKSFSKCAKAMNLDRKIISAICDTDKYYKGFRFQKKV